MEIITNHPKIKEHEQNIISTHSKIKENVQKNRERPGSVASVSTQMSELREKTDKL